MEPFLAVIESQVLVLADRDALAEAITCAKPYTSGRLVAPDRILRRHLVQLYIGEDGEIEVIERTPDALDLLLAGEDPSSAHPPHDGWAAVGDVEIPSGVAIIGDPGLLIHLDETIDAHHSPDGGPWIIVHVPDRRVSVERRQADGLTTQIRVLSHGGLSPTWP